MKLISIARVLRQNMTRVERKLWWHLRDRSLGAKFRRQAPIGPYVADFACFEHKLIIELDGGQHSDSFHDKVRDAWLAEHDFTVLRFWNNELAETLNGVLDTIYLALNQPQSRVEKWPPTLILPHSGGRVGCSRPLGDNDIGRMFISAAILGFA